MKKLYIQEDPEAIATKEEQKETIITNPETIKAIEEARRLANGDGTGYNSFEELWKDVFRDE